MPGELIEAAQLVAGTGASAWLVDKLLGPSFDALGQQFSAFSGSRVTNIFNRASEKSQGSELHSLPPGFALQYLQKASYSEEDDVITDMWAELLITASTGFSAKFPAYLDALSNLGAEEAKLLERLVPKYSDKYKIGPVMFPQKVESHVRSLPRGGGEWGQWIDQVNASQGDEVAKIHGWPMRVSQTGWADSHGKITSTVYFGSNEAMNLLERQALIGKFSFDLGGMFVEGVYPTAFGLRFIEVCRGNRNSNEQATQ